MRNRPDADAFATIAAEMQSKPTVDETAEQVITAACTELEADHAGITLLHRDGRLESVAPSDAVIEKVDKLQHELDEGPCVRSAYEQQTLTAEDLRTDTRWPRWGPQAASLGINSVLSCELASTSGQRIGAVNLYWAAPHDFTPEDIAFAQIFRRHAAVALSNSMAMSNLHTAMDTRKQIGMAQGMVMERYGLTPDQAFNVLRRYSQEHNRKLRDVAQELIETRELPRTDASA